MSEQNQQVSLEQLQSRIHEAEQSLQASDRTIAVHFDEMARVTQVLEHEQAHKAELEHQLTEFRQQLVQVEAQQTASNAVNPDEQELRLQQQSRLLLESELFDADWYLAMYPDIKAAKTFSQAPHEHYLRFGAFEGRNPCPEFDSAYYLSQYPDVADTGTNPLVHYLLYGREEGRHIHSSLQEG
ncbi:hypothetical protein [Cobetia sp. QF-1]|uniref:hypothetical protein n=1 Tax=Cobetia sp. QF-1 TaxID=1969833 RepID=UPI000B53DF3C|nr:hypothetical protein [Cobetia sp. QF-1]